MKPKLIHKEAMEYSFKAKQALDEGNYMASFELFKKAAKLESQVAKFYFDKPKFEPTRSIIIRSATYLNLKAGDIDEAQKLIFFGLLNISDELIKQQLSDALEISVSLKNMNPAEIQKEYSYINALRQRSIHYTLEPLGLEYGHSVTLGMIKDFADNYLKSLKAYALSKTKQILVQKDNVDSVLQKEIDKIINPLITSTRYGSFQFSIANDFVTRVGENEDLVKLKSTIINTFHNEVFINSLDEFNISQIKEKYTDDEINDIFRPLTKIKSNDADFKIGYYDMESYSKKYVPKIINNQKSKLLTTKSVAPEDIGELINTITHKRVIRSGKISKKTISIEEFRRFEKDLRIKEITPKDHSSLILTEEILVNMTFDSNSGFTISFDDLKVTYTNPDFEEAFSGFNNLLYQKIITIAKKDDKSPEEQSELQIICKLIENIEAIK